MNTPICDFVNQYFQKNSLRLHMPGHKGQNLLGFESSDITEIEGADSLFEAEGIIRESEENASKLFSCKTLYSTEGSSLCIRAMMYLVCLYAKEKGISPLIFASRNVHKSFLSAAVLLDFDIEWLYPQEEESYLSCNITPQSLQNSLDEADIRPVAVYVTSPDYLGNTLDIQGLSEVCKKNDVLLVVDNAHGAYLKFLPQSSHPIDLGADMCCDSAHKTLPVLTGGAYLHINENAPHIFSCNAKNALSLFASTSPSYLILQSLDFANKYISEEYTESLHAFLKHISALKATLTEHGYTLLEKEPLKITIDAKKYGYYGKEFATILAENNIECEFSDNDFVVLMLTEQTGEKGIKILEESLLQIPRKNTISAVAPKISRPKKVLSLRDAAFSCNETIPAHDSLGRVLAFSGVSCPPAVPIVTGGELIDENCIKAFEYYSIKKCVVTK
ncbi:MAG: aminotransferase class I/II-fold pyridoxal phosphate-dependent enzyme [Clostridia bacterium]|nr:aminotransferase class I/II-fold pyridoxal phosphate-dependent enzyme [Clostridia bacterium]